MADGDEEIPTVEYGTAEEEQTPLQGEVEPVEYQKYKRSNPEKAKNAVEGAAAKVGEAESKFVNFLKKKKAEYDAGAPERARKAAERKALQQAQQQSRPQPQRSNPVPRMFAMGQTQTQSYPSRRPPARMQPQPAQSQMLFAPPSPPQAMAFAPSNAGPTLSIVPPQQPLRSTRRGGRVARPTGLSIGGTGSISPLSLIPNSRSNGRRPQQASFSLSFSNQQVRRPSRKARRRKR